MTLSVLPTPGPDHPQNGISRTLALGRILHFEALMRRRLGEVRPQRYVRLHNYYSGQNLPPDNVDQPLLINRFKPIVDKHTSYLWGQYEKHLIEWKVTYRMKDDVEDPAQKEEVAAYGRKIKRFIERVYKEANGDRMLWNASKNASLYGDGVLEVRYDEIERRIVFEAIQPEYFHAMWEISNMAKLVEVIIAYPIDRVVALETWGTNGNDQFIGYQAINPHYVPGIGILWKRWSTTSMQVWVDDTNVLNQPNPYMPMDTAGNIYPGIIPFLHIPNMQGGADYWGYSDGEAILYLSDELNRRLADAGDIVNTHAHPITTLKNFQGDPVQDLPVGPDAVWDLGRDGEANRLEGKGPPPDVMAYINEIKTQMAETAAMPQTAYGTHSGSGGGSHSTGLALQMAMMPVVERAKEKRIVWKEKLEELAKMVFYMMWVRDPDILEAAGLDYRRVRLYDIEPVFSEILPKDELQKVNENVALSANGLRSMERSLEDLGEDDISTEIARIKADMLMKASLGAPTPGATGTAGKNSEQGMGGSMDLPGSIGSNAGKPGVMIKSDTLPQMDNLSMAQEV